MIPIRTYLNVAQAELAKSLLDDHGIFCAVAHENAHLYGGSPFAMPIQLLVAEDQARQAIQILDGRVETATDAQAPVPVPLPVSDRETRGLIAKDNPWELLVMAALFLLPGIWGLWVKYPAVNAFERQTHAAVIAVSVFHFFALLAVAFAMCLIFGYVYARASIVRDKRAASPQTPS